MECYPTNKEALGLFSKEYCWLNGEELLHIFKEEFQCIWGVISAFDKKVKFENVLKYDLPYSDGYTGFWINPVKIQHPLAKFEIVAWDGEISLFISDNAKYTNEVKKRLKKVKDLEKYNMEK